ncbi:Hypothetical protein A7982_11805 [Minicystis rosea]|nr:Hypothetical protein A7982_11805 [Minicystis rosea]
MVGLRVGIAWLSLSLASCSSVFEETKASSSSTSGEAPICAAGAVLACDCPGGHQSCLPDGSGFGACEGCVADVPWSKAFGDPEVGMLPSALVAPDDSVVATVLVGGSGTDPQSRILKFDPSGGLVWERHSPGRLRAQAVDENGNVVLSGWNWNHGLSLLDGVAPCAANGGDDDACVSLAKLDFWTGDLVWSRTYFSQANLEVRIDVAGATESGQVGIVGLFDHDLDLGSKAPLVSTGAQRAAYVASIAPDGATSWARVLGSANDSLGALPRASAMSSDGSIAVTGLVTNQIDFGSGVVTAPVGLGGTSVFVAVYGPSGEIRYTKLLGSEVDFNGQEPSVSFDAEGHLFFALVAKGIFDLGAGPLGETGVTSNVVAKLDDAGQPLWTRVISASAQQIENFYVTADAAGNAWTCGGSAPEMTFGAEVVPYAGHPDPLLLAWSGAGEPLAMKAFPGTGWQSCTGVRLGKPGGLVIVGNLAGNIDFGQGPLLAVGPGAGFIAKLGP